MTYTNPRPTTRELDAEASEIASEWLSGTSRLTETEVRWRMVELVTLADIPRATASSWACQGRTHTDIDDLTERVADLLTVKAVGDGKRRPTLNLTVIAGGASLSGWARNLARTAMKSEWRNTVRSRGRVQLGLMAADGEADYDTFEGIVERDRKARVKVEAADVYSAYARISVGVERVHLQAKVLQHSFGVPELPRMVWLPGADRLREMLAADGDLAVKILEGRLPEPDLPDPFGSWDAPTRGRLAGMDPRVAHTLAVAAVTPMPPPPNTIRRELRDRLIAQLGSELSPFAARRLANEAVRLWAAARAETAHSPHCYAQVVDGTVPDKEKEVHAADRAAWRKVAGVLAARGVLGSNADEVSAAMDRMASEVDPLAADLAACGRLEDARIGNTATPGPHRHPTLAYA